MPFSTTLRGQRYSFPDLRDLLAKANEEKSGDALAGIAATSHSQRAAAKTALTDVSLAAFLDTPLVCPDDDNVSRVLLDDHDRAAFATIASWTVGELRDQHLSQAAFTLAAPVRTRRLTVQLTRPASGAPAALFRVSAY